MVNIKDMQRKKFPSNFTDLSTLALITWLFSDFEYIVREYIFSSIVFDSSTLVFVSVNVLLGGIIFMLRLAYNRNIGVFSNV